MNNFWSSILFYIIKKLFCFNSTLILYLFLFCSSINFFMISFETRKTIKRFEDKLDGLRQYLKQNIHIIWLVPKENMKKFVNEQIKAYNWKLEQHHIEIFNS
ncbi:hypothetical protein [Spiroplasma endosymbiont of Amphimallon solstitiale]|uniref:hypothetical protein n=1 Tax=Spiroplasma endosymbiont of Amphimallon solstitiale TaxID=3066288 RepID=UPI00313B780B